MNRALSQLSAALTAALVAALLMSDPASVPTAEAAALALRGLVGAGVWGLVATGIGGALLGQARLAPAFALGAGVLGLSLLPLAALGWLTPMTLGGVAVIGGLAWLRRPEVALPELSPGAWGWAFAFGVPALLMATGPSIDTDEVYQHLALPKGMLMDGGLLGGLLHPDGSRPIPIHLLYAGAMVLGGEAGPKLLHLGWAALLVLHVQGMGRRLLGPGAGGLAALALLGSYTFVRETGLAYNNLPTALWALLAFEAALEDRRGRVALFSGMALAAKYTAAPVVVGAYLLMWTRAARSGKGGLGAIPEMALWTAAALLWVAPWWLRNLAEGLHPLFPYAGWPEGERFAFTYVERYGMGRGWRELLLLPWNLTVHAETTSYQFLGRVSPVFLLSLPGALVAGLRGEGLVRPVLGVATVCAFGWALGPHWLRYLLPAMPILALAAGAGFLALPRWGRGLMLLGWLAGAPSNLGPWLAEVAMTAPASLGVGDPDALTHERIPGSDAADWVNDYAPDDAQVALLFAWPAARLERPWVMGSVEDHVPTRHLLLTQGEGSLGWLREQGVTHVLRGRVRFIPKSYPFLDEATFREQFVATEALLDELLLAEGTLVFESGRYSVWRLNTP